jgi:hypothetical protein
MYIVNVGFPIFPELDGLLGLDRSGERLVAVQSDVVGTVFGGLLAVVAQYQKGASPYQNQAHPNDGKNR